MMRRILTLAATLLVASVVAGGANGAPVTSQGMSRAVELEVN